MLEEGVNEDVIDGFLKQGEVEFENIMNSLLEKNAAGGIGGLFEMLGGIAKGIGRVGKPVGEEFSNLGKGLGDTFREAGNGEGLLAGLKNIYRGESGGLGSAAARVNPEAGVGAVRNDIPRLTSGATEPHFEVVGDGAGAGNPIKQVNSIPAQTPKAAPPVQNAQVVSGPGAGGGGASGVGGGGGASAAGAGAGVAGNSAKAQAGVTDPGFMGPGFWARRFNKAGKGALYGGALGAFGGLPGAIGGAALGGGAGLLGRAGLAGVGAGTIGGGALLGNSMFGGNSDKYGLEPWKQNNLIPGVSNNMLGTGAGAVGALMLSKELGLPLGNVIPLLLGGYLGHKFLPGIMGGNNPLSQYGYGYSRDAAPTQL